MTREIENVEVQLLVSKRTTKSQANNVPSIPWISAMMSMIMRVAADKGYVHCSGQPW